MSCTIAVGRFTDQKFDPVSDNHYLLAQTYEKKHDHFQARCHYTRSADSTGNPVSCYKVALFHLYNMGGFVDAFKADEKLAIQYLEKAVIHFDHPVGSLVRALLAHCYESSLQASHSTSSTVSSATKTTMKASEFADLEKRIHVLRSIYPSHWTAKLKLLDCYCSDCVTDKQERGLLETKNDLSLSSFNNPNHKSIHYGGYYGRMMAMIERVKSCESLLEEARDDIDHGGVESMLWLGEFHLHGLRNESEPALNFKDADKAKRYLRQAADAGNSRAQQLIRGVQLSTIVDTTQPSTIVDTPTPPSLASRDDAPPASACPIRSPRPIAIRRWVPEEIPVTVTTVDISESTVSTIEIPITTPIATPPPVSTTEVSTVTLTSKGQLHRMRQRARKLERKARLRARKEEEQLAKLNRLAQRVRVKTLI